MLIVKFWKQDNNDLKNKIIQSFNQRQFDEVINIGIKLYNEI